MELRDILQIFYKERATYIAVVVLCLLGGLLFSSYEPARYQASLLLTVGRTESAPVTEYSYDSFYRLQADERFADTLVRLLGTSRVTEDIMEDAGVSQSQSAGYFTARRLSSQVVEVTYQAKDPRALPVIGASLTKILATYTEALNAEATKKENWFRVIAAEPVVSDARIDKALVFALALFTGLFLGFWLVLIRHYLYGPQLHAHRD
jgi:uncharacterized protein involved in exopolysaccharide biosynthesis